MRPTHTTLLPRLLAAALCLLACGLLVAACGGSSSPSGSGASAEDSALKFSRCMREHGVKDFPNPESGPGGATREKVIGEGGRAGQATMEAAQEACRHFQEEGEEGHEPSPQEKVEREEQVQRFAKCMREHGIELEVHTSGGATQLKIQGSEGGGPKGSPAPAFEAAQEACQGMMPGGPKGGPGPGQVRSDGGFATKTPAGG
jgi:hypothetical protein